MGNVNAKIIASTITLAAAMMCVPAAALAEDHSHHGHHGHHGHNQNHKSTATHQHKSGEWMLSYRHMSMNMEGNLRGSDGISPETIVSSLANPSGMPPNVRVVPTAMQTEMHMVGVMYGVSEKLTLMAMFNYLDKHMDHVTFQGMSGTTQLGAFSTDNSGLGDTKVVAHYQLWESINGNTHQLLQAKLGLSIPTGSIDESGQVLTPMNTTPTLRLPYAMQLGSGTYDLEPSIYFGATDHGFNWGGEVKALLRLSENDEDYSLGNLLQLRLEAGYLFTPIFHSAIELSYTDVDKIDGQDILIAAPVQTANPQNYGGQFTDLTVDATFILSQGNTSEQRLGVAYKRPIKQNVNGVQMNMANRVTASYELTF